jgi:hypothetical protein
VVFPQRKATAHWRAEQPPARELAEFYPLAALRFVNTRRCWCSESLARAKGLAFRLLYTLLIERDTRRDNNTRHTNDTGETTMIRKLINDFANDNAGFIISAELVLISTIAVLALVVGLAEVSSAVNQELEDVASAFGSLNQSFSFEGQAGCKASATGTHFDDFADDCDSQCDISCGPVTAEQ